MFKIAYSQKNTIEDAINLSYNKKISFLDTLLIQTMLDNNIYIIYSENEKVFKKIRSIKCRKIFK